MKASATIPRINARQASRAAGDVMRDVLRRAANDYAQQVGQRMHSGLAPDGTPQRQIEASTRQRGTTTPLVRTGRLANSWRAYRTADGAVVRPEPNRGRVATILQRQGYNLDKIGRQDAQHVEELAKRASTQFAEAIQTGVSGG